MPNNGDELQSDKESDANFLRWWHEQEKRGAEWAVSDRAFNAPARAALAAWHAASDRDESEVRDALERARLLTAGIYGRMREMLASYTKPCVDNCEHGGCAVLRDVYRAMRDCTLPSAGERSFTITPSVGGAQGASDANAPIEELKNILVALTNPFSDAEKVDRAVHLVRRALSATSPQSANTSTSDYEEVLADHRRLCRELDAILSYPDEPARQASLCDLIPFAKSIATRARRYRFLRDTPPWKSPLVVIDSRNVGDDIRMLTLEALDAMIDAAMADVGTTKNAADRKATDVDGS